MTPVIKHLQTIFEQPLFVDSSLHWDFASTLNSFNPLVYSKLIKLHPILILEYSVLCNQLRDNLFAADESKKGEIIHQVAAALMLAELLEHVHLHYLIVPREVARLRRHQMVYRTLLTELSELTCSLPSSVTPPASFSLSQHIRENTALTNWFRLLLTRSKRVLNFIDLVGTGSDIYSNWIGLLDKYTNPIFAYLAWCFFIPRLLTNICMTIKHSVPWFWMKKEEKTLEWRVRLDAQIKRRWFELGNDIVWVTVGLLNCFVMVGVLAPAAIYLTLFAFAFDVINTSLRAYIELSRLYTLQTDYTKLALEEKNMASQTEIKEFQLYITRRTDFEKKRLGLSCANTLAVFMAMSLAVPALLFNPVIPLAGAFLLVAIWVASYTLTLLLEQQRPNDAVELPPAPTLEKFTTTGKLGFFSQKNVATDSPKNPEDLLLAPN